MRLRRRHLQSAWEGLILATPNHVTVRYRISGQPLCHRMKSLRSFSYVWTRMRRPLTCLRLRALWFIRIMLYPRRTGLTRTR
ncbi:hypothetical protein CBM2609_B130079 [Cupriavidus taiwanensis]|nr:hypothetical protein CBM2609_B130079 [Cupriavidus taiwanensis]SOZ47488.1 hypothetical protein CBM2610_B110075 [Cupriavidus taiwanensis]